MKKTPKKKKTGKKPAPKKAQPRKQFVTPRTRMVKQSAGNITIMPLPLRFVYVEARRFEDGVVSFDHIEVLGARNEPEAYTFGAAQLDTRQQTQDPAGNAHLLAPVVNDYVLEVK